MEETKKKKSVWQILSTVMLCIAIFVLLVLIAFNIFFYKSPIVGISMQPTYNKSLPEGLTTEEYEKSEIKDKAYVYRFGEAKIGDVVMIEIKEDGKEKLLIKRLVAKGGDTVDIQEDNGTYYLFVNGKKVEEKYVKDYSLMNICYTNFLSYKNSKGIAADEPITLAKNELFVLGDNRGKSKDSSIFGPVKNSALKGVVAFVVPYDSNLIAYLWNKIF